MQLEAMTPAIGSEVHGLLPSADMDDAAFRVLERALGERGLLVFRDCGLDAPQQAAFAARFGDVLTHPAYDEVDGAPGVTVLESTPEAPTKIEVWHTDMTFRPAPPKVTMLHARILPPTGGDTLYASTAAAFAALPPPLQTMLRTLTATHDFRQGFRESLAEPGGPERLAGAIAENPPVSHPVVTRHPVTGAKCLNVNALFTLGLDGFGGAQSRAILDMLYAHIVQPEFVVRLRWAPGTLALWDNRCTQHKPVNDYFPAHRRMHRVTVLGDAPVAA